MSKAPNSETKPDPIARRLSRLVGLAQVSELWERLWRGLVPPLLVAGAFLCVSWLGLWLYLPHWARACGVGLFGVLLVLSCWRLRHLALIPREIALRRIDAASGIAHRPASVLDDKPATTGRDPTTDALWALHRRRAEAEAAKLRAGRPSPRVVEVDRYALRGGLLVALVACAVVAGSERYARVAAAFDFGGGGAAGPGYRLDAWVDPPPYTGKAPALLDLKSEAARNTEHPLKIAAPAGSVIIIRSSGGQPAEIQADGPLLPPASKKDKAVGKSDAKTPVADRQAGGERAAPVALNDGDQEKRLVLHGDSRLTLRQAGGLLGVFDLTAIPDKPPTIALREVPKANVRGSLTLAYTVGDDYGVASAEAVFSDPKINGEPVPGPSLVAAPKMQLSLPGLSNGLGDGETTTDLSEHPWAGAQVKMVLVARDEGGNEGRSEPVEITLPQKPFTNPVARALVEQRRQLVLDPSSRVDVGDAIAALMIAPEKFGTTPAIYLGLRFASDALEHADTNDKLREVADFLWGMALQLENGDLSDAERALRQAEKELRDAIERHASDEEIQKLTQNLQAAMDKFLKELAEQQKNDRSEQAQNQRGQSKSISPRDLQKLIERLKEQARNGNREEAKKALDELQNILENLKTAKRQKADPNARVMAESMNQLDQMMRDQQDLRDETYKQGQQGGQESQQNQQQGENSQSQDGQQGDQGQQGQQGQGGMQGMPMPGMQGQGRQGSRRMGQSGPRGEGQQGQPGQGGRGKSLGQRQKELRDRLGEIQKKLKRAGEGQGALGEAEKDMREAEEALRQGNGADGQAVDAQGRALDALQQGAKKLAEAMQKQQGNDPGGEANGQQGGEGDQMGQQSEDSDPLGRPRGGNNTLNSASRFDPLGIPAAQRAQRVLEELRRRLADPSRAQEEIDYLERLLRSY